MFDVTIHDCCIQHIDDERIIDVHYWDYDLYQTLMNSAK